MSSDKDYAITAVGLPQVGQISKKPSYLLTLQELGVKGAIKITQFITMDKPDLLVGFVHVKGIFTDLSEEEIIPQFAELLASAPKDQIVDIMFPNHRIHSIRSLVFNANKATSLVR